MINKFKYTGKNRKYLNKQVIEYMKSLIEVPKEASDMTDCMELIKVVHDNVIRTSDEFRKEVGFVLDYRMDENINSNFMCERFITNITEKYLARAIQFIAVDIYVYANYEEYRDALADADISTIRSLLFDDMINWLEKLFIKTQQLYLKEGIIEKRSCEEIEEERRENEIDEKMFWEEYGEYIDFD